MKVLIVYAHPEVQSFNHSLKDMAVEVLERQGHQVIVSDLYAMNFDPVAKGSDFIQREDSKVLRYASEQNYALKHETLSEPIKSEYEKLLWADFVIFQFPVWWFNMPAILKGWFDKVYLYGGVYGGKVGKYENGGLVGKKAMLSITTNSSKRSYQVDGYSGEIHSQLLFSINHGLIFYSGMDAVEPFIAYRVSRDEKARENYLKEWEILLNNLEERAVINYPTLASFGEQD